MHTGTGPLHTDMPQSQTGDCGLPLLSLFLKFSLGLFLLRAFLRRKLHPFIWFPPKTVAGPTEDNLKAQGQLFPAKSATYGVNNRRLVDTIPFPDIRVPEIGLGKS